jgi:4-coumarate--CoA ligase
LLLNYTDIMTPEVVLPFIPDNLSVPQFILDTQHPARPLRKHGIPWLIEDASGREVGFEEVSVLELDEHP